MTTGAGPACPAAIESWTRECATASGLDLTLRACRRDGFVVGASSPDGALLVDVSRARPDAFRRVGDVSLAPIGEFADWSREPAGRQHALDAVAGCVTRAAPAFDLATASRLDDGEPDPEATVSPVPWLLVALAATSLVRVLRRWRRPPLRPCALLAALALATFGIRWMVVPRAFFHQNGQGPDWVDAAWRGVATAYGPGYAETYRWLVARSPAAPEGPVFLLNALAGAVLPVLAYALARRASSSRVVAGALAVAFAVAPIGARLAQSESYFVPIAGLLFIATLALTDAAGRGSRSLEVALDLAIAALAIAQAARIHPIAWIPAALTPLVVAATTQSLREVLRPAATATAVVGLTVVLLAGRSMWAVLHGSLGRDWMPSASHATGETPWTSLAWLAVVAWLFVHTRSTAAKRPLALLALAVGVAVKTNLVRADTAAVNAAYAGLHAPVALVLLASGARGWLARLPPWARTERVGALAIVAAGALFAVASAGATCTLPTDARELSWVLGWRRSVPQTATVAWYGHAGRRMLDLPLYRRADMPRAMRLDELGEGPTVTVGAYYVHTSLCATDEGRAACEGFERSHHLVPVERRVLPAIPSLPWLPFPVATVEAVLYRVEP